MLWGQLPANALKYASFYCWWMLAQEIVALVTCGLLREALLSQCVLAQRGALDAFYAMEIPQGEISGGDTDAHNEATFALLESIFPSRSQGLTDSTKSEFVSL